MKNIIGISLTVIALIAIVVSCRKAKDRIQIDPDPWILPPNGFYFLITQNGVKLHDSILEDLKFYYFNANGNKVLQDPNTDNDEFSNHVLLPSRISGNEYLDNEGVRYCGFVNFFKVENNTWYFEYPGSDIDTLYVENSIISKEEGRQHDCNCINPFSVVRFNGKGAYKHPTLKATDGKPVWVLEK